MHTKSINNFIINPIGIGTWLMGGGVNMDTRETFAVKDGDEHEIEAVKYSISKGQNHIDTAEMYGAGHTEEVVGKAIQEEDRSKLFIASKLWRTHAKRDQVIPAVKEMLKRLHTDYLDMLYIHAPWEEEDMNEYIPGVNDAVDEKLTKSIAVSNFNVEQLKQSLEISKHQIVANQLRYNILYKTDANEEMRTFCAENNIMIVAYRPVERKLLADEVENEVVKEMAKKYHKTPAQIAINWLIMQENVVAIPKASEKAHIDENLEALDFELDEEDSQKLFEIKDMQ